MGMNVSRPVLLAEVFAVAVVAFQITAEAGPRVTERPDLVAKFTALGTEGTMVVHDRSANTMVVIGEERAARAYSPSSTFKIPNTLIALEMGAVQSMSEVFAYAGDPFLVDGKPFLPDICNGDISLDVALRNSCIPVYQQIAQRVGAKAYNESLTAFDYGSGEVNEDNLTEFWLNGDLVLSALDQVAFLDGLVSGDLPVSEENVGHMANALAVDVPGNAGVYAKTGYVFTSDPARGWYVGWVKRENRIVTFALNLDIVRPDHTKARQTIAFDVLRELGVLATH
jgi:beta-lactamase class D